jgi:hypothetical protein
MTMQVGQRIGADAAVLLRHVRREEVARDEGVVRLLRVAGLSSTAAAYGAICASAISRTWSPTGWPSGRALPSANNHA